MNKKYNVILLPIMLLFLSTPAYSLSTFSETFSGTGILAAASKTTRWYEIRNFTYVDFLVLASAGSGTITVQYASDKDKTIVIDDPTISAFATGVSASVFAGGVTKYYIRARLDCAVGPCTYTGIFTAKGTRK